MFQRQLLWGHQIHLRTYSFVDITGLEFSVEEEEKEEEEEEEEKEEEDEEEEEEEEEVVVHSFLHPIVLSSYSSQLDSR